MRLRKGQVIAISVEYEGEEDANFPRFTHFCQVTSDNARGSRQGSFSISPPVPIRTPDATQPINGESRCTHIRYVSEQSLLTFHGVSKLTQAASGNVLNVASTKGDLLPAITSVSVSSNNSITAENEDGDNSTVIKSTAKQPTTGVTTYIFDLPDLLTSEIGLGVDLTPQVKGYLRPNVSVSGTSVTVSYSTPPPDGYVTLEYVSSARYSIYQSGDSFPAGKRITEGSVSGRSDNITLRESNGRLRYYYDFNTYYYVNLDYETGEITAGTGIDVDTVDYVCLLQNAVNLSENQATFSLNVSDPILDSFYVRVSTNNDVLLTASSDDSGNVTGTSIIGNIDNGVVTLTFAVDVDLTTLRFDISETVRLLPPAELYGLNPLRIPNGGRVNIFTPWKNVSVQHSEPQNILSPAAGQTKTIRQGARFVDIIDKSGASLWTVDDQHYSVDSENGSVTINSDFSGFEPPFILTDTIGELIVAVAVDDNSITLGSSLTREYPAGSIVSSVQHLGDLQARVGNVRDMTSWQENWSQDGNEAAGNLNVVDFPIEVNNQDAINEEWVLEFQSGTSFRCAGERLGVIATGDTVNDFAPINPLTNKPYFVIRQGAFGGGWSAGEAIRFYTKAAAQPVMAIRSTRAGHSAIDEDKAVIAFRGNES